MTIPACPPELPRLGNDLTRWLARTLLRLAGWRIQGDLPRQPQFVAALAPHTSNWDFIIAMLAMLAMGVKASWLAKHTIFRWPLKSLFLALGGVPVDRSAPEGMVEQLARWYEDNAQMIVAITPEGTRSKTEKWKSGFLRLARRVEVPVLLVGIDYPSRTLHLGKLFRPGDDMDQALEEIRVYYQSFTGKHPHLF